MITAGVTTSYADNYGIERLAAQAVTGCATGALTGRGCEQGAKQAAIIGTLEWVGHFMRENQIENSKLAPQICDASGNCVGNLSGTSAGIDGDLTKIGGERFSDERICGTMEILCQDGKTIKQDGKIMLPSSVSVDSFVTAYVDKYGASPLGGIQGSQGLVFGISYSPGGVADKVIESFAGPHDWLNSFHYYDALGNNLPSAQTFGIWNVLDVFLAAPMGLSTLNSQIPLLGTVRYGINQNNRNARK
jgi:filamentous hemagglutinin